jgi:hypothetical protein
MNENTQLFDVARQIDIKLKSAAGVKTVTVRFPTDEEWIDRQRKRKIIIKQIGRGMSETILPGSEDADGEFVAQLRVDADGPEIDGFEATSILDQLSKCEVDDVTDEAGGFLITLRVPGVVVTHLLQMPSSKQVIQYRRAFARVLDLPYNKQQLTVNLGAAGDLFKKLNQKSEGYAGAVPIIHQAVAVKAAIDSLESGFGNADAENF